MNIDKSVYADDLVRLGRALRSAREDCGLSTIKVAELLGVDASTISKIERGCQNISVGYLIAMARVYGLDVRLDR